MNAVVDKIKHCFACYIAGVCAGSMRASAPVRDAADDIDENLAAARS